MLTETILTALFVFVILCVTADRAPKGMAPVAIGVTLTVIHLMSIPVTNTSVNPARSIGPALFAGPAAIGQLWLFITAPIIGAVLAGICHSALIGARDPDTGSEDKRPEGTPELRSAAPLRARPCR
jgi:aquaporin Z